MDNLEENPLIVTYVLEEDFSVSPEWYSLQEAAELAALASIVWFAHEFDRYTPDFTLWLESGYRKHMRRAKPKQFERLLEENSGTVIAGPHGRIFVSEITPRNLIPKSITSLQLSGFKPREDVIVKPEAMAQIVLNEELSMSFGKSVVAAAHGAQQLYLSLVASSQALLNEWSSNDFVLNVTVGEPAIENAYGVVIEDHGLTEVEPGSITAAANFYPATP